MGSYYSSVTCVGDDIVLYSDETDRTDNNYDYAMVSGEVSE